MIRIDPPPTLVWYAFRPAHAAAVFAQACTRAGFRTHVQRVDYGGVIAAREGATPVMFVQLFRTAAFAQLN